MAIDPGLATIIAAVIGIIGSVIILFLRQRLAPTKRDRAKTTAVTRKEMIVHEVPVPVTMTPERKEEKPQQVEEDLVEVTKIIREGDYVEYAFRFDVGNILAGNVESDEVVNVFLMDTRNFNKFAEDEEFDYLDGDEDVTQCKISAVVDKSGNWHLVVENAFHEDVEANIKLRRIIPFE